MPGLNPHITFARPGDKKKKDPEVDLVPHIMFSKWSSNLYTHVKRAQCIFITRIPADLNVIKHTQLRNYIYVCVDKQKHTPKYKVDYSV